MGFYKFLDNEDENYDFETLGSLESQEVSAFEGSIQHIIASNNNN